MRCCATPLHWTSRQDRPKLRAMKFFVFIAILVTAWYVLRWMQNAEVERRVRAERRAYSRAGHAPKGRQVRATDTIVCSRCGAYVPAEFPTACDRKGCPFPGVG